MLRSRNQVVLPLEIEKIIPKDDPVFKLAEICDKLDYSRLEKEYVRAWRNFQSICKRFLRISIFIAKFF